MRSLVTCLVSTQSLNSISTVLVLSVIVLVLVLVLVLEVTVWALVQNLYVSQ